MNNLNKDWFLNNHIDEEYQKYVFFNFIQNIDNELNNYKVYPNLINLTQIYNDLITIKSNYENLEKKFPKETSWTVLKDNNILIEEKPLIEPDNIIQYIFNICNFTLPILDEKINKAKNILDIYFNSINIYIDGLYKEQNVESGYLLINLSNVSKFLYEYNYINLIVHNNENYTGINLNYIDNIKYKEKNKNYFIAEIDKITPFEETILPSIKKKFLIYLKKELYKCI